MTPLLKQYLSIKKEHKDAILLFHIGDFYETFYEDAKTSSSVLDITLTSKPMGKGTRVPLAGIPIKAADSYIDKLVKSGYKVAICEQVENVNSSKGLVKRKVTEVITSGTIMRPSLLNESDNNFIIAVNKINDSYGLAFMDLTTGEFRAGDVKNVNDEIMRLSPVEIILPENLTFHILKKIPVSRLEPYRFDKEYAVNTIKEHFNIVNLDSFGLNESSVSLTSAGALLSYCQENLKKTLGHVSKISVFNPEDGMILDTMTIKNLELTRRINGEKEDSLYYTIDRTITSKGARTLKKWLLYPLTDIKLIMERLDGVEELIHRRDLLSKINKILEGVYDIERINGRISTDRATPRDLLSLKDSLIASSSLKKILGKLNKAIFRKQVSKITDIENVVTMIKRAIVDNPPAKISEGGIFRDGYNRELDKIKKISSEGKKWMVNFEKEQKKATGIDSLKVGYNSVFGYYIEVTKPNIDKVPDSYIKKQTLTNSERFITQELKTFESEILSAEKKLKDIENELFKDLIKEFQKYTESFEKIADAEGVIDVLCCFAENALKNKYVKPTFNDENYLSIKDGRHPVVENLLPDGEFIPNNTKLNNEEKIMILTGPNMSGKSTYLRQIALISILSQIGSYVPASSVDLCIIDRIFTRIGASDDLSRGVSTFLAEMNETANILNNVTNRSIILLDEIGRGTSTYDGLAIAWSVVEYLHSIKESPHVLFATHYHELTELEEYYNEVVNYNVRVIETENDVIFKRQVRRGSSDRSYGIEVAKLAGLPEIVIKRAKELLEDLKHDDRIISRHPPKQHQLELFNNKDILLDKINNIKPDELTPKQALEILYKLKEESENS